MNAAFAPWLGHQSEALVEGLSRVLPSEPAWLPAVAAAAALAVLLGVLAGLGSWWLGRLLNRWPGRVPTVRVPWMRPLAGVLVLLLAAVPLMPDAAAVGLLAWVATLVATIILVLVSVRLAASADVIFGLVAKRTDSPLDDLLAELVGRILRVVLPLLALGIGGSQLIDPLLPEVPVIALVVVASIAWAAWQGAAMLDRLLLAGRDLSAKDNLAARRMATQVVVIRKIIQVLIVVLGGAAVLMQFDAVRQIGTSLLASVGLLSMIIGLAAQKTLANLLAGIQIALTQPVRLDDVVIIEGEWGRIEEITLTYAVVAIWDQRRLIVPISHLIEKPFQNWTRNSAELLGTVNLPCDHRVDLDRLRTAFMALIETDPRWDKRAAGIQVVEAGERTITVRALVSSADASAAWDLRCAVREGLIRHLAEHDPAGLPQLRHAPLEDRADAEPGPTRS